MCEQCCDCIPCGSKSEDIDKDGANLLYSKRHNCPLHWVADVCKLYPDIKYYADFPPVYYDANFAEGKVGIEELGEGLREEVVEGVYDELGLDGGHLMSGGKTNDAPAPGPGDSFAEFPGPAASPVDGLFLSPSPGPGDSFAETSGVGPSPMGLPMESPTPAPSVEVFARRKLLNTCEVEGGCFEDDQVQSEGFGEDGDDTINEDGVGDDTSTEDGFLYGGDVSIDDIISCHDARPGANGERATACKHEPVDVCRLTARYRGASNANDAAKVE